MPSMKLNLKFRGQRHSITVENSVDLVTLMAMAVEAFHLEGRFYLSLNGVDKISRDLDVVTIDTLGLVNGDTIYVLECPCETAAVCSAESNLHANAALASVLKSLNLTSNSEVLCATIHHLLIENGFKNVGEGEGLPADWRQLSGVGFFRLLYENQISSVIVELTITIHGKDTDNEVAYVRASFDVGIEKDNVEVPVALTQQLGTFSQENLSPEKIGLLAASLRKNLVSVVHNLAVKCNLKTFPEVVLQKIASYLSLVTFSRLTQTCKALQHLWHSVTVWKDLLHRDFGSSAVADAEAENAGPNCYFTMYQRRYLSTKRHRSVSPQLPFLFPRSDNNIQDPDHAQFPGIGGPADLNPLYPFRPPRLPQNFPAAPRQPFGPRFDPLYPDAPGLIDIPRPGRPRRRPNPDGYDPPFGFL